MPDYAITQPETISVTVPAAALAGRRDLLVPYNFTIVPTYEGKFAYISGVQHLAQLVYLCYLLAMMGVYPPPLTTTNCWASSLPM